MKYMIAAAVVLVAVLGTVALIKTAPKAERKKPPISRPLVSAMTVQTGAQTVNIRSFGSVKAKRSITVVPQVSGEIISKSSDFEAGGYFTAGQILLRIDDTDYVLAVERAIADVAQAEYNLARAEEEAQVSLREWDRIGKTDGGAEATALVLNEPQLKLARATLSAAKAAQHQAEVNLGRCIVKAPFDGRVLTADVDAGQYLRAGTSIGSLYATDVAEITVSIADDELSWISIADEALDVDVGADFGGARHVWQGRAVRLGGAVDARSRLVPVVVEVPNPYEASGKRPPLIEGMFVEVTFTVSTPENTLVIPRTALRPGNEVWVIDTEDNIRIRTVTLARAGVEQAVVSDGLQVGDRICTSNLQYVTDGMPVRIEGNSEPAAGPGHIAQPKRSDKDGEE